ncbi:hypothetical protein ACLXAZ_32940 [Escherichia coli]
MPTLSRRLLWPLAILLLVLGRPLAAADLYYLGQRIPDIQKPWDSHDYQVLIDALKKIDCAVAIPSAPIEARGDGGPGHR